MPKHWTIKRITEIEKELVNCKALFVELYDNERTPNNLEDDIWDCDIILGYSKRYNMYAVWNAFLHRGRKSVSTCMKTIKIQDEYTYRTAMLQDGNSGYEKQLIISPMFLKAFCNNWLYYLMPTEEDKNGFDIQFMWADRNNPTPIQISKWENDILQSKPRNSYVHTLYERDTRFREMVINNYDNRCAICHCTIKPVLEAHHIVYVSEQGNDNLCNGICLCRNHHKMVHSKLIKLNLKENTYEIDNSISEDPLTKYAIDSFHNKLIIPKSILGGD